jgi:hypothetical protein
MITRVLKVGESKGDVLSLLRRQVLWRIVNCVKAQVLADSWNRMKSITGIVSLGDI